MKSGCLRAASDKATNRLKGPITQTDWSWLQTAGCKMRSATHRMRLIVRRAATSIGFCKATVRLGRSGIFTPSGLCLRVTPVCRNPRRHVQADEVDPNAVAPAVAPHSVVTTCRNAVNSAGPTPYLEWLRGGSLLRRQLSIRRLHQNMRTGQSLKRQTRQLRPRPCRSQQRLARQLCC